jgi:hypothetical protein
MASDRTVRVVITGSSAGAVKAFQEVAGASDNAGKTAASTTEAHGSKIAGHVAKIGGAAAAVGGGITAALGPLTEVVGKSQDLTAQLGQALQNSGQNTDGWKEKLEGAEAAGRKLGITNEQTIQSVQALVQAGVPYTDALKAQADIADIATGKHEDLATATQQVIKATQGHVKGLADLGVSAQKAGASQAQVAKDVKAVSDLQKKVPLDQDAIKTATDKVTLAQKAYTDAVKAHGPASDQARTAADNLRTAQDNLDKAQNTLQGDEASLAADRQKQASDQASSMQQGNTLWGVLGQTQKRVGGEASASAQTVSGHIRTWKADIGDLAESVGTHLMPVLAVVGPAAAGIGSAMTVAGGAIDGAKKIMGLFKPAAEAAGVASGGLAVAEDAEAVSAGAAATATSLLDTALAVLTSPITIVIVAVAALVTAGVLLIKHWDDVKKAAKEVWDKVSAFFVGLWHDITGALGHIKDAFTDVKNWISDRINDIKRFIGGIPDAISGVKDHILNALKYPFQAAFHYIAKAWNDTIGKLSFSAPSWVPVIGGKGFSMPTLPDPGMPSLQYGGMVLSTGLAVVHEGETFSGVGGQLGGGDYIDNRTANIYVMGGDPQAVVNALKQYMRSNGTIPVTVNAARRLGAA